MMFQIRRLIRTFRKIKEIYLRGGYTTVNISYTSKSTDLEGKKVLITGGGSGIGFAMAKLFVKCGAEVIITGRNEQKLKEAINIIDRKNCHYLVWDISDVSLIPEKLKESRLIFNSDIDILINNAGLPPSKFWGNVDSVEWEKIYNVNLKGCFFLCQEIAKYWKIHKAKYFRKIINISSQGGFVGATYPYRMVKWDVRGLTEGLGKLLINDDIIVNGIAPGVIKTAMQEFALTQGDNVYTDQNPSKRIGLPEEIAELALFLASGKSNFIVGQTIVCDGGYILK